MNNQYAAFAQQNLNALSEVPFALGRDRTGCAVRDTAGVGPCFPSRGPCPSSFFGTGNMLHGALTGLPDVLLFAAVLAGELWHVAATWAGASLWIVARVRIVEGAVLAALSIGLVKPFGISGLLWAVLASTLTGNLLLFLWDKKPGLRFSLHIPMVKELFRIGFPIFLNSMANGLYWSVDAILITVMLPADQLGIYGFGLIVFPLVQLVPEQFAVVSGQRMARQMGERGRKDLRHVIPFFEESQSVVIWITVCAAAGAGILFVPVVHTFFPDYIAAIPLCHALLFGFLFYRFRAVTGFYLSLTDRQGLLLAIQSGSIALNGLGDWAVLRAGWGIGAVAWVCAGSYVLFGIVIMMVATRDVTGGWRLGLESLARWTPLFGLMHLAHRLAATQPWTGPRGLAIGLGLAVGAALLCVVWGWWMVPAVRHVALERRG